MDCLVRCATIRNSRVVLGALALLGVLFISYKYASTFSDDTLISRAHDWFSGQYAAKPRPCRQSKYREQLQALVRHWEPLAKRYHIEYVIAMGSLVGQFENEDMLPWDRDVDVLVDVDNYKVLKKLSQKRNFKQGGDSEFHLVVHPEFDIKAEDDRLRWNCEGKRVPKQEDSCSFVQPVGRLVYGLRHLDIFHFTRVGTDLLDVPDIGKQYNRTDFYPFVRCTFMDTLTWCPNDRKKVLETRYGPIIEKLVCANGEWFWVPLKH